MSADEVKKRFEEALNSFRKSVEDLLTDVEKLIEEDEFEKAYDLWKTKSRELLDKLRKDLSAVIEEARKLGLSEKDLENLGEMFRHSVREIGRSMERVARRLWYMSRRGVYTPIAMMWLRRIPAIVSTTIETAIDYLDSMFRDVERAIERSIGEKYSAVASARLRKSDLDIIDELVDAGIFRSRSEAIAYFVRRGIEASKEWIEKVREQIKKIRELQESIRKEIEDIDKDSGSGKS